MSEQLGIGSADLNSAQIIDLGGFHGYAGKEMKEDLPREHKILEVSYAVNEVDSCSACYASLTGALWRLNDTLGLVQTGSLNLFQFVLQVLLKFSVHDS
jgi:hypothetical protein